MVLGSDGLQTPWMDDEATVAPTVHSAADSRAPLVGEDWEGRLPGWLNAIARHDPDRDPNPRFQSWSFPTDGLLAEYLAGVAGRREADVRHLLRCLLFGPSTFGADQDAWRWATQPGNKDQLTRLLDSEYGRRLVRSQADKHTHAQPGVRWVVDALPDSPRAALAAIDAYVTAHGASLPDGRLEGLSDARAVVASRYLRRRGDDGRQALHGISPRELEQLAGRLYTDLGYVCELTPRSRDGGRDVVAVRDAAGRQERRLIECKHYSGGVPVAASRALLGMVSTENATSGVLLTTGRLTAASRALAARDDRLDLVDGDRLLEMLADTYTHRWPERLDSLLAWPPPSRGGSAM
jgi:restriction system protein